MKKLFVLFIIAFISKSLIAQFPEFEQVSDYTNTDNFPALGYSSVAFADVNNDNNIDVLITGKNTSDISITKLFTSDGSGNFTEVLGTPFDGVYHASIAFVDINNDNNLDVLITGRSDSDGYIAKLYTNDGTGSFSEVTETPFEGVGGSSAQFSDIDNDNDKDVLISGFNYSYEESTRLYTNDGNGSFTEVEETPFEDAPWGSITFVDIDNDNDDDVLISGQDYSYEENTKLYTNDGNGNFTEITNTPFEDIGGTITYADIDNDNDQDILINGSSFSKLYINDGTGLFTADTQNSPYFTIKGLSAFADVDNDNDVDLIFSFSGSSSFLINDGTGIFSREEVTHLLGTSFGSLAFADIDNDNDIDLLISGYTRPIFLDEDNYNAYDFPITQIYVNNGEGAFSSKQNSPFIGVSYSSIAYGDFDNDNDQDIIISGTISNPEFLQSTKLYLNDGNGKYSGKTDAPFHNVAYGCISVADIDNDNDLDVLISGEFNNTILYINDGLGNFKIDPETPAAGLSINTSAFADIDNDDDLDLLVTSINYNNNITKLYTNDGLGNFTEITNTPFEEIAGAITFADIDNDNDQDVLISGTGVNFKSATKLFINDGFGIFSEDFDNTIEDVKSSSSAFADIDNDNDLDLLILGSTINDDRVTKLYTNDGTGTFTEVDATPFDGFAWGSITFSDFNHDNNIDLLLVGATITYKRIAICYTNDGTGNFTEVTGLPFEGVDAGSVAILDIDNDNDKDVLITGSTTNSPSGNIAKLYKNTQFNSIKENKTESKINIFPNPVTSHIFIEYESTEKATLNLINEKGVNILQKEFTKTIKLNIKNLKKGVYLIEINSGTHSVTKKVIKI